MDSAERFSDTSSDPPVHGFLHRPESSSGNGLILTHGAGGNAQSGLLQALAEAFAASGLVVLRCDLPFRQLRHFGPPGLRKLRAIAKDFVTQRSQCEKLLVAECS